MVKAVRFPVAALASIGAALVIGNISVFREHRSARCHH